MAAERPLRMQALWVRVDANRTKLAVFVTLFVTGSAALITAALVALPGWLLGWGAVQIEMVTDAEWFGRYPWVVAGAFVLLLLVGAFIAAVQLANAQDWVGNRFAGRPFTDGEFPGIAGAAEDMTIAAGLPAQPALLLLDSDSVNACAIGTSRGRPAMGFTRGFTEQLTPDEQRAVIATLTARIAAGDILFATALAALMGPIKAIRGSGRFAGAGCVGCADVGTGCGDPGRSCSGCADVGNGCSGCADVGDLDSDAAGGCIGALVIAVFLALVAAVTYVAVLSAAWIVTLWGRALHRTSYEKADAEGMLLLKDPSPMLSALGKVIASSNEVGDGDPSYDGIFYAATSGTAAVEKVERRRYDRLREVLGIEGLATPDADGAPPLAGA